MIINNKIFKRLIMFITLIFVLISISLPFIAYQQNTKNDNKEITLLSSKEVDYKKINSNLKNVFLTPFSFSSDTSPYLDSELDFSIINPTKEILSNSNTIKDEIDKRVKNAFGDYYNTIFENKIGIDFICDNQSSVVYVKFYDLENSTNNYIKEGFIESEFSLNVKISFSETTNQKKVLDEIGKDIELENANPDNEKENPLSINYPNFFKKEFKTNLDEKIENFLKTTNADTIKELIGYSIGTTDEDIEKIYFGINELESNQFYMKIEFDKDSELVKNRQWLSEIQIKIDIKPSTSNYNQENISKRYLVFSEKKININSVNQSINTLSNDIPSVIAPTSEDPKTYLGEYTYSSSVNLLFFHTNDESIYDGDTLLETYNNISILKLDIKKNIGVHTIKIKKNNEEVISFKIKLFSVSSTALQIKWDGWNPTNDPTADQQYYNQWLITQETIPDPNDPTKKIKNDKYDPSIDVETGLKNSLMFVQSEYDYTEPVVLDPINNSNEIIKSQNDYKKSYGYLSNAIVANSGVDITLPDSYADSIDHVVRVELNEETFEEIKNTKKTLDFNDANDWKISVKGLYNYIIYLKDYSESDDNQDIGPNNPPTADVKTTSGSVIYKTVYINNEQKAYTNFLDLDFISNNEKVLNFWNSYHSFNFKKFIKEYESTISYSDLSYETIIAYWRIYATSILSGKVTLDFNDQKVNNLSDLDISTSFKINADSDSDIKTSIINALQNEISNENLSYSEQYGDGKDYFITDDLGSDYSRFNDVDVSSLRVSNDSEIKTKKIYVRSTKNSLNSACYFEIEVSNSKSFNIKSFSDISKFNFKPKRYNFSKTTNSNVINIFILNYIENVIKSNVPNDNVVLNTDYKIKINNFEYDPNNKTNMDNIYNEIILLISNYKNIKIQIQSLSSSNLLIGKNSYIIYGDENAASAPSWEFPINLNGVIQKTNLGEIDFLEETYSTQELWTNIMLLNKKYIPSTDEYKYLLNSYSNLSFLFNESNGQTTCSIGSGLENSSILNNLEITYKTTSKVKIDDSSKKDINDFFSKKELTKIYLSNDSEVIDNKLIISNILYQNNLIKSYSDVNFSNNFIIKSFEKKSDSSGTTYSIYLSTTNDNKTFKGNAKFIIYTKEKLNIKITLPGKKSYLKIIIFVLLGSLVPIFLFIFYKIKKGKNNKNKANNNINKFRHFTEQELNTEIKEIKMKINSVAKTYSENEKQNFKKELKQIENELRRRKIKVEKEIKKGDII